MPAVVSSTDGSYDGGTSDADGMRRWSRSSKNDRKRSRISAAFIARSLGRRIGGETLLHSGRKAARGLELRGQNVCIRAAVR